VATLTIHDAAMGTRRVHKSILHESEDVVCHFSRKVCNIEQLLQRATGILLLVSINGTRSWVSDCTSFDLHDRFTLRLDSTWVRPFLLPTHPTCSFLLSVGDHGRDNHFWLPPVQTRTSAC
jgi:hypothetical protein